MLGRRNTERKFLPAEISVKRRIGAIATLAVVGCCALATAAIGVPRQPQGNTWYLTNPSAVPGYQVAVRISDPPDVVAVGYVCETLKGNFGPTKDAVVWTAYIRMHHASFNYGGTAKLVYLDAKGYGHEKNGHVSVSGHFSQSAFTGTVLLQGTKCRSRRYTATYAGGQFVPVPRTGILP